MRLILGFRGKAETIGGGQFFCPRCKNETHYVRIRVARYFTFFFIPTLSGEDVWRVYTMPDVPIGVAARGGATDP